jgi:hypothetical protein
VRLCGADGLGNINSDDAHRQSPHLDRACIACNKQRLTRNTSHAQVVVASTRAWQTPLPRLLATATPISLLLFATGSQPHPRRAVHVGDWKPFTQSPAQQSKDYAHSLAVPGCVLSLVSHSGTTPGRSLPARNFRRCPSAPTTTPTAPQPAHTTPSPRVQH